jgi:hypothetical protein
MGVHVHVPDRTCRLVAQLNSGATTFQVDAAPGSDNDGGNPTNGWRPALQNGQRIRGQSMHYTSITQVSPTRSQFNGVGFGGLSWPTTGGPDSLPPPHPAGAYVHQMENQRMMIYGLPTVSGAFHIEGCLLTGNGGEGINGYKRGSARFVLQNIRINLRCRSVETFARTQGVSNHHDLFQPRQYDGGVFHIDRLTGYTPFQGMYLDTQETVGLSTLDWRNSNIRSTPQPTNSYSIHWWNQTGAAGAPINLWSTWQDGNGATRGSGGQMTNANISQGVPPGGDFCPPTRPGVDYVIPGYVGFSAPLQAAERVVVDRSRPRSLEPPQTRASYFAGMRERRLGSLPYQRAYDEGGGKCEHWAEYRIKPEFGPGDGKMRWRKIPDSLLEYGWDLHPDGTLTAALSEPAPSV